MWSKTPGDRARDQAIYGDPEYQRNRAIVRDRACGRCQQCGRQARLQVDHITPVTQGGTHDITNLQALCEGCHRRKTATEGGRRPAAPPDPPPRPRTSW